MKNALPFIAIASLVACRHEEPIGPEEPAVPVTGTLKVSFRPTWNGVDFDKTNVYLSAADERVLIQQVKFYLSPITFSGDTDVVGSEAELLDITNGPEERWMTVPASVYDSLHYGLGVPYDLNHRDITTVTPPDPLDFSQGMYWTWATMYRFMIFDGRYDTDPGGTGTPPYQFSLHTGRDECYRERTIPLALDVVADDTIEVELEVDIARFFTDGTDVLDLSQGPQSHGESQNLAPAMHLSDLAVKSIIPD